MEDETGGKESQEPPGRELRFLRGVGPRRGQLLARIGLCKTSDLLLSAPRRHEDRREITPISKLKNGLRSTVCGEITTVSSHPLRGRRHLVKVLLGDDSGIMEVVWFNQAYLGDLFAEGQQVVLTGKADVKGGIASMASPEFEIIRSFDDQTAEADKSEESENTDYSHLAFGRLVPVYPLTEGIGQRFMRQLAWQTLEKEAESWPDLFTEEYRRKRQLLPIAAALRGMHYPDDPEHQKQARRRLAYEELLVLQTVLALRRKRLSERGAIRSYQLTAKIDERIRSRLPFTLTAGQESAVREISRDMAHSEPMNRLLQGDVGSGKTAVAAYACLLVVAYGSQATIMAPTEVLAEQHFRTFSKLLKGSRVRIAFLAGSLKSAARKKTIEQVATGQADIVIATHSVIQKQVLFRELGLVILDEQHKFGVAQRHSLTKKGPAPHVLVMSATPIPRTLSQAFYADLDLSVMRDFPGGERKITTRVSTQRGREKFLEFVVRRIAKGERAYFIYPAIADGETSELASAESGFQEMSRRFGAGRVGLLHGQMKTEQKRQVMEDFRSGRIQILVATTVVEVGVDVPEATVMVIEDAERFGLATLHQLRGRIGRGPTKRAWCLCVASVRTKESLARLKALASTQDGFRISEEDFRLRGPGQFLGERQHGLPELRFTDLVEDSALLDMARRDAREIVRTDPLLTTPPYRALGDRIRRLAAKNRNLAGVA